jgi:hypothetical protein
MPSSKNAVVLVVISFLLVILIYSSVSIHVVFANITRGPINCVEGGGPFGTYACCQKETDSEGIEITWCTVCDKYTHTNCSPRFQIRPGNPQPPGTTLSPSAGLLNKVPGASQFNAPITTTGGNTSNPGNATSNMKAARSINGVSSPTGHCSVFSRTSCIPCDPGLPEGRYNCIPTSDWPSQAMPSTGNPQPPSTLPPSAGLLNNAPSPTSTFNNPTTGNIPNLGNTNNNTTSTPPVLSITKEHNPASPKVLNSQQTTTCSNALPPDANGNCPTSININQQGGSASNNNNPTSGHHKGSNQPTQTGGGQELTATKKHKGPKTDQGTTQSPS